MTPTLEHGLHQHANDWMTCKCGKLFADSKKGRRLAEDKFMEHLIEVTLNGMSGVIE